MSIYYGILLHVMTTSFYDAAEIGQYEKKYHEKI